MKISHPTKIIAIRTNILGHRHFDVRNENVGYITFIINGDYLGYIITRPWKDTSLFIDAENVTGVIYADGCQVLDAK